MAARLRPDSHASPEEICKRRRVISARRMAWSKKDLEPLDPAKGDRQQDKEVDFKIPYKMRPTLNRRDG
ncbi:protein of unknown function [Methylocella tundrae]|uniref:Uncharacterized protein n=1 Tax=Methylocella tundrae TaxID=227605 RepID=A0A4U8Z0S0_METTU|nr:protein of unknown function [Methylocella tundrae]